MSPSPSSVFPGVLSGDAIQKLGGAPPVAISASGAIDPHTANRYVITKATVAALTLAAPTATADDGLEMDIYSDTAEAHTITATGLFEDGAGNVNEATFAAHIGASIGLFAYQGKWFVKRLQNVTMS